MDTTEAEEKNPTCSWRVDESDETKYNYTDQKGMWRPKPEDILSMFEKLAKGGSLPLSWQCPGRRSPKSEEPNEKETETEMEVDDDNLKEEYRDPEPSAFDFDDSQSDINTKVTPWRSHAGMGRTPKTEKRVARMDTIMDSLRKQQIQRAAEREARKAKASPSQQGKGRLLKFGSPISKGSASTPSKSSSSALPPSSRLDLPVSETVTMSSTVPTSSVFVTTPTSKSPKPGNMVGTLSLPAVSETADNKSEQEIKHPEIDKNDVQMKLDENTTTVGDRVKEDVLSNHSSSRIPFMTASSGSKEQTSTPHATLVSRHQILENNTESVALQSSSTNSAVVTSSSYSDPTPTKSSTSFTPSRTSEVPNIHDSLNYAEPSKPFSESLPASKDAAGSEQQASSSVVTSGTEKNPAVKPSPIPDSNTGVQPTSSVTTTTSTDFVLISSGPNVKKVSPEPTTTTVNTNTASISTAAKSESEG